MLIIQKLVSLLLPNLKKLKFLLLISIDKLGKVVADISRSLQIFDQQMGDEYEEEFEEEEEEIIEVPVFHKKVAHNLSSYVTEFNEGQTNGEEIQTQTSPPQTPTTPTPTPTPTPAPQPQLFKPAGWTPKRVQSFQASSTTPVQQPIITTTTTTTTTPTPPNVSAPVKRPSEKKEKKESKKSLDSSGNIKEKTKKSSSRSSVMPNNNVCFFLKLFKRVNIKKKIEKNENNFKKLN